MKDFSRSLPTDLQYSVIDLKSYLPKEAFRIKSTLAKMRSEYWVCSKEVANKVGKTIKEISAVELFAEGKRLKYDILNNRKTEDKSNSGHRQKANGDTIKDVLLFIAFSGIFFSFIFLIWNISSGHWDFGTSGFEIVIIILAIIFIILLKKRK